MRGVLVVAVLLGSLACGCMSAPSALAPSTIPVDEGRYTVIGPADGSAWGVQFLGLPLSEPAQAKAARDRAVRGSGGDALVNVSMSYNLYMLGPLNIIRTRVRGEAVKLTE